MTDLGKRRLPQLAVGLVLYGVSIALMVEAALGLNPWDTFHQGVSQVTGLSIGVVVLVTGIPLLLLWIPLRQRPGIGTIANVIVVGPAADLALAVLNPGETLPARIAYLVGGVLLNAVATAMYLGADLGPGPRDGLMTGLVGRFPRLSVRVVRTGIEILVLAVGFLLGGTAGIGTILYAVTIGPLVQVFLPLFAIRPAPAPDPVGAGGNAHRSAGEGEMS